MAQILKGAPVVDAMNEANAARCAALKEKGIVPTLAVVRVGAREDDISYEKGIVPRCGKVGVEVRQFHLAEDVTQEELLDVIRQINGDASVHGCLIFRPLPKRFDDRRVQEALAPEKDVDGFHVMNAGKLLTGTGGFMPCTPYGVMKMIESVDYDLTGKEAVVVGRSNIVGKPQALMLLAKNATVTVAHSRTADLADVTRRADVLIAAVGRAKMITGDMVKPGALVIDVGMNRDENGKLCGDVDTASVMGIAGWVSPVPGGVGPMTIAMLMTNTVEAVERRMNK